MNLIKKVFFTTLLSIMVAPGYSQGVITIDHKTQRFIDNVSVFSKEKYANAHLIINNNDAEFTSFKEEYNIDPQYVGGRGFWNPFSKVKNGVIPGVSDKYSGVREVNKRWVATGTQGNLFYDDSKDYSVEDVSDFSKEAAAYVAQSYRDEWDPMPEYIEPFNEPMVHANEFYPENWDSDKTDIIITKICEYHRDLGQAIHTIPELKNLKVTGFASAYPSFENNEFDQWNSRYKKFIDIAGAEMDVLSFHLYDGSGLNNDGGRRSGSNVEAIIDLIEAYSFIKFDSVKPLAVTEYGRLVQNQTDWSNGNGEWNYEPIRNSQATRSQIHMVMSFMERASHLELAIPFNVDTRNPTSQYSKSSLWINNNGKTELTPRKYFYEILKDLKGKRARINSTNIDIQTQAFVHENQLFVMLNNLNDETQTVNLSLLNAEGLQSVDIKQLKIFIDKLPKLTKSTVEAAPENISLEYGETAVLTYNFDAPVTFENKIVNKKYYTKDYLQTIVTNQLNTFIFEAAEVGPGVATLRLGVGREHGLSLTPEVFINDKKINIEGDIIRGTAQPNRSQFFGVLEIPFPIDVLKEDGLNKVEVKFPDSGGKISSAILQVQKADKPIEIADDVSIGDEENINHIQIFPNPVKSGDKFTITDNAPQIKVIVCTLSGKQIYAGNNNVIDTAGMKPGVYIVTVKKQTKSYSSKLIVI